MRDWDYRDRFEGPHTFKGEVQDNGSDAGYKTYWKNKETKIKNNLDELYLSFNSWKKCL